MSQQDIRDDFGIGAWVGMEQILQISGVEVVTSEFSLRAI
jgi:hypothetical protein